MGWVAVRVAHGRWKIRVEAGEKNTQELRRDGRGGGGGAGAERLRQRKGGLGELQIGFSRQRGSRCRSWPFFHRATNSTGQR